MPFAKVMGWSGFSFPRGLDRLRSWRITCLETLGSHHASRLASTIGSFALFLIAPCTLAAQLIVCLELKS
jgi:hypothetical protein